MLFILKSQLIIKLFVIEVNSQANFSFLLVNALRTVGKFIFMVKFLQSHIGEMILLWGLGLGGVLD